jgi:hypothetical protein
MGDSLGVFSRTREGEREDIIGSQKDWSMLCTHTHVYENNIPKSMKYCLKRGKKKGEQGSKKEGMSQIKVYCTTLWKYHNETLCMVIIC